MKVIESGFDEKIINAMAEVPREEFVPEQYRKYAYLEVALPLENGIHIFQQYHSPVVARMSAT